MAERRGLFLLNLLLFPFLFKLQVKVGAFTHPVPAVFIFGDSTADVGNNNFFQNNATANFPPYGIDFPGGIATGRFSNGFNTVDFLCKILGFRRSPPPFLSLSRGKFYKQIFKGINFASAGSGILNTTGNNLGVFMSMHVQLSYFATVVTNLTKIMGPTSAEVFLSRSLFLISTGSNDIFENFNIFFSKNITEVDNFISSLGSIYNDQFKTLYNLGARRFGIISIPPIGCCPSQRSHNTSGGCLEDLNDAAQKFFAKTVTIMHDLSLELKGMKHSIGNVYTMVNDVYQNPLAFGFTELSTACCGEGTFNGQLPCTPNATLCFNRDEYLFWDFYHPSQDAARLASQTLYGGLQRYVTPINIMQLVMDDT